MPISSHLNVIKMMGVKDTKTIVNFLDTKFFKNTKYL